MFGPDRFFDVSKDVARVVARARRVKRLSEIGPVDVEWHVAADDASHLPMTPEESGRPGWKYLPGCPSHIHADLFVDRHGVHVDVCAATMFGPGRSWWECRIFVEGTLSGRGHRCGSSIGVGGRTLPAIALVGRRHVLCVDVDIQRIVQVQDSQTCYLRNDATVQRPVVTLFERVWPNRRLSTRTSRASGS